MNALPYLVPRWLARRIAKKETDYATTRLLASVAAFPALLGARDVAGVARRRPGVGRVLRAQPAVERARGVPLSRRHGALRERAALRRCSPLTRRHAASRLLDARRAVIALIEQAKTDYLAATRGSSF